MTLQLLNEYLNAPTIQKSSAKNYMKIGNKKHGRAFMPNCTARHDEMIKSGHMQTDSANQGIFKSVEVHHAVKFEQTYIYEIDT